MTDAPLPPLTALRAFEAASRHGSLSGAARELNVTHAAVAQQVKKLEDWFGFSLMQRAGRGVATTEKGARLAEGLAEGFASIRRVVSALAEDDATRPLRITLTPTFASNWLMPRLGGFRVAHPEIELMLNATAQTLDLSREDYDLGFRFGRGDWPGLEIERMLQSDHAIVAAPELLEGEAIEEPADLLRLPWVQELGIDEWRVWLEAHGVAYPENPNVAHMQGNLVLDSIRRGQGVGITGREWVKDDIAEGRLIALFEEEQESDVGYYLAYRPGPQRLPLKKFLRWVRAQVRESEPRG